jgi:hypothetical protein
MAKMVSINVRSHATDVASTGTIQDAEDMYRLGKKQVLNVGLLQFECRE